LRYVDYRSGNTLYIKAINWGWVNFNSGTTELKPGMIIGGQYSESAVIDQVLSPAEHGRVARRREG